MLKKKAHSILITLLLFLAQPAVAQDRPSDPNRLALLDFMSGFEDVVLPFQIDPPSLNRDLYPLVADRHHLQRFLKSHGLAYNTTVRAGQVIVNSPAFIALTVLVSLNEEHSWYLITFSSEGKALDKGRIAGFSNNDLYRYEHWSEVRSSLQIEQTSVSRFYDQEGNEEACTRTHWQWQLQDDGYLGKATEELSEDCAR